MTNAEAEKIVQFAGQDTYDSWTQIESLTSIELTRSKKIEKVLRNFDPSLGVLAPFGTDHVEKVKDDIYSGLKLILTNKFPDPARFAPLFEIWDLASDIADRQMDEAEAIPLVGLLTGGAALRSAGLKYAAGKLHQELMDLEEKLEDARDEETSAEIRGLLDFTISVVEVMAPGVGLIAAGAATAIEIVTDEDDAAADATTGAKLATEGLGKYLKIIDAGKMKHVVHVGGKTLIGVGIALSARDIWGARGNKKELQAALDKTQKDYREFVDYLNQWLSVATTFQDHMENVNKQFRYQIDSKKLDLLQLAKKYKYSFVDPYPWPIVYDPKPTLDGLAKAGMVVPPAATAAAAR